MVGFFGTYYVNTHTHTHTQNKNMIQNNYMVLEFHIVEKNLTESSFFEISTSNLEYDLFKFMDVDFHNFFKYFFKVMFWKIYFIWMF